jgi:hypothetical protein
MRATWSRVRLNGISGLPSPADSIRPHDRFRDYIDNVLEGKSPRSRGIAGGDRRLGAARVVLARARQASPGSRLFDIQAIVADWRPAGAAPGTLPYNAPGRDQPDVPVPMNRLRWLLLCCAFAAGTALGAPREFPPKTRAADMYRIEFRTIHLADRSLSLAPGAQIRNQRNLIVQPITVTAPARIRYLLDRDGQVSRVWILTPEEARLSDRE